MKSLTVSLPDDVYKKARIRAAERETSVSGLVRELLAAVTDQDAAASASLRRKRALNAVLDEIHKSQQARGKYFNASERLTRDQVHDRKTLR